VGERGGRGEVRSEMRRPREATGADGLIGPVIGSTGFPFFNFFIPFIEASIETASVTIVINHGLSSEAVAKIASVNAKVIKLPLHKKILLNKKSLCPR
jgi:hypothetical protein